MSYRLLDALKRTLCVFSSFLGYRCCFLPYVSAVFVEISILKKKHGKIDFFQTLPYASDFFVKIRENADTAAKLVQNTGKIPKP